MHLTYLGHSCFVLETGRTRIVIDPGDFERPNGPIPIDQLRCQYVLLSHGHEDHAARALEVAQAHGATIVANYEIAEFFAAQGVPTHGMNPGGGWNFPFGRVKFTIAHHTSSMQAGRRPIYLGEACGLVVEAEGKRLYHAGDTALFLDMQLIARGGLDAALIPIGDNLTMGPDDAIDALDLLKPKVAVPIHYNTWAEIRQDPREFAQRAAARGHVVRVLSAGESIDV